MDDSVFFDSVDDEFLDSQKRIAVDDSSRRLMDVRNDAPIPAPDNITITPTGGIAKPIGLKEVGDLYGVSPRMSNLRGKGSAPNSGPFGLSVFEGDGGAKRYVGTMYIDRWDDLTTGPLGLFGRPDYSWDGDGNTSIGNNTNWHANLANSGRFAFPLAGDPSKVVSVQKVVIQYAASHITTGGEPTVGYWVPQYLLANNSYGYGSPWQSTSNQTVRHTIASGASVVNNGVIGLWPNKSDWDGIKRWVANGFMMNFSNKNDPSSGEKALANAFYVSVDVTVKI